MSACKDCAFFGQTYRHDIEREDHAYQFGTCAKHKTDWRLPESRDRDSGYAAKCYWFRHTASLCVPLNFDTSGVF